MILWKKALRGVRRGGRSYLSCTLLLALGIGIYVAFHMLYQNLTASRDDMYQSQRFGDAFALVKAMSPVDVPALEALPGVARAEGRLQVQARVLMEGDGRIITLRLLSYRPEEPEPLNGFLLSQGALPGDGQLLLGEAFAQAHGLEPGDGLTLLLGGKTSAWTVSGSAKSPDYVYVITDASQLLPDTATFGVAYLPYRALAALSGQEGVVNDLSFLLEEGARFRDVEFLLEDGLASYGLEALYPREDQASHTMLDMEIGQIGSMSSSIPLLFILIAVIILHIMLRRIIQQERGQIGTLKAFGYSDASILLHYAAYGLLVGVAGGLLGCLFGVWMAGGMTGIYLDYFYLPDLAAPPQPGLLIRAFLLSAVAAAGGACLGARSSVKLAPAQAMRPAAPPQVRPGVLERIPALGRLLASHGQMAVRNIARNRFRSAFVLLGMAVSFGIMAFMASFTELMDSLTGDQFTKVQLYDVRVSLDAPRPAGEAREAAFALEGVDYAESLLELPVRLQVRHRREDALITGLAAGSGLYRIHDSSRNTDLDPPSGGLILTQVIADKLEAAPGDLVTLTTFHTGDREYALPVLEVIEVNIGSAVYMEQESLCRLLGLPLSANGVLLRTGEPEAVSVRLAEGKNVSQVLDNGAEMRVYDEMMSTYAWMLDGMQLAGVAVAYAIITVTASISLSERSREYATLRVLGMHPREVAAIASFEYWLLAAGAVLVGIPLTRLMKWGVLGAMDLEAFQLSLDTSPRSFLAAGLGCLVAVALSNLLAARRIGSLDLVEVLKERE